MHVKKVLADQSNKNRRMSIEDECADKNSDDSERSEEKGRTRRHRSIHRRRPRLLLRRGRGLSMAVYTGWVVAESLVPSRRG